MTNRVGVCLAGAVMLALTAGAVQAQPGEPPSRWTVAASAGLALTSGNSDTSTFNAAYDIVFDPANRHRVKSDALFLRGTTGGELSTSRFGVNVRDELQISPRAFVFAQNQYLRDAFKDIDYLVAPTAGAGYTLLERVAASLIVDGGVGGVWEKNTGFDVRGSGAMTAGEKLVVKLTETTTITQMFGTLWKLDDFEDGLYTFGAGLAAAMSTRTQLKVEVLDTFKNRPPLPTVQKNDVALLMAIVYKR